MTGRAGAVVERVAVFLIVLAAGAARAELPAAQFAGAQLEMAQAALEQAREALEEQDYAAARGLAAQAGLDARLAWGMSESQAVRRAASQIGREAETVRWRGMTATPP